MKQLLVKLEPIIWLLFGQGILLGTILLTGWVLVVGVAVPFGIVPAEALSYERGSLARGQTFDGPALVLEPHSATWIARRWSCTTDGAGALVLERSSP